MCDRHVLFSLVYELWSIDVFCDRIVYCETVKYYVYSLVQ